MYAEITMVNLDEAFLKFKRRRFVPKNVRAYAEYDQPLSIGYGQTISQPTTVHRMLLWLDVHRGYKVLDIGSGSGWTTALLSVLVGSKGKVYAIERIPMLRSFGQHNCDRSGVHNARFYDAPGTLGLPEHAPYDRILVSASANQPPLELCNQLKEGGKLVVSLGDAIVEVTKARNGVVHIARHSGYMFVPLTYSGPVG